MKRSGLAPLELVLALPLLLMVMALMVGIGVAATWKVRAQVTARNAAWSHRWPRSGGANPRPVEWPAPARLGVRDDAPIALGDQQMPGNVRPQAFFALPHGVAPISHWKHLGAMKLPTQHRVRRGERRVGRRHDFSNA